MRVVYGENGKPATQIGVWTDITERKRVSDELKESERRFREMLSNVELLAVTLDNEGKIVFCNDHCLRLTGWSLDEIVGKDWFDTFVPPPVDKVRRLFFDRGQLGTIPLHRRGPLLTRTGEVRQIAWNNTVLRNPAGELAGTASIGEDITDWLRAEEELARSREELEERVLARTSELNRTNEALVIARDAADSSNAAKSKFLSRMSHELRTPLNAILGFGQLMEVSDLSDEQRQDVELILKSGGHLLGLIDEVLEIARIESGAQSISVEPVDVSEVMSEAIGVVANLASERHVSVQVVDSVRRYALADRRRLLQVVLNVLTNSIKYNVEGGVVRIRLFGESDGMTVIEIADTGIGMTAANLTKLFTPFERLGAEALHIDGTGLGLALSKSLVESMGGTFSVTSEKNIGSVFTISLVRSAPFDIEAHLDSADRRESKLHITTPCKVLLIEDNPSNVKLIQQLFEGEEHVRLLTAESGRDGMKLASRAIPDVIILDLHLPDITGQLVLSEIKSDKLLRHIPVIVLTADAFAVTEDKLALSGAFACFSKPVKLVELMNSIRDALEVNRSAA
ncbi:MAG: ATP-binding protein [Fimbriimonadaceae bacterium]